MVAKHVSETQDQAVRRLALEGLNRGLTVAQYAPTGEWYCTSYTAPDRLHRVTLLSCDCPGFLHHGRCTHHALLLHHLGQLPPAVTPARAANPHRPVVLCDQCGEPMRYLAGVSFDCACGHAYAPDWEVIDKIEMAMCAASGRDGGGLLIDALAAWLAADFAPVCGNDPDECPCREDAPGLLGLHTYSANELSACLIWQADRQDVADRMVA